MHFNCTMDVSERYLICFCRMGGGHQAVRWGAGLVPQILCGGNHESQRTPPQPPRKYPHQMCHTEAEGGGLKPFTATLQLFKLLIVFLLDGCMAFAVSRWWHKTFSLLFFNTIERKLNFVFICTIFSWRLSTYMSL